jgi:hypothetical protein
MVGWVHGFSHIYVKNYILSRWKPYLKSPILLLEKRVKKLKYTLLEWFGWVRGEGWGGGKGTISQNDECGGSGARPCL